MPNIPFKNILFILVSIDQLHELKLQAETYTKILQNMKAKKKIK
jgi:hypothetical protein